MGRSSKNVSCRECRSNKKGCSREVDGCTGCRVRGIPCIYPVKTRNLHIQDNAASLISDKVSNEELGSDSEMQFHLQGSSAVSGPFIQTSAFFEPASLPSPPLCKTVSLPLIRIMQVLDSPLIVEHDEWMLEDPDLMPTYDDFRCVHAFITFNPRAAALMSAMDIQAFITTFFLQPAPLR
ncbi:hypothetical protein BCR33DRAFT_581561 [Rhizoclosmatium globosum]|uniref:Zn(2)-C6 fungal-type domain-containing protein n=1 Tax=Rhizoclosmatium globosum TaxID=329046 RepID=A0A1Y2CSN1_9FUNG|nr:hypothetical protein BCR33DRAFT_581561 [Rhizoclosmatium globosum]|eukprot:ORY49385.1 hypothetical protein BCR33DRAFT_581561 [Rhizoclosmatium globosum]